jgi:hypothetical protein
LKRSCNGVKFEEEFINYGNTIRIRKNTDVKKEGYKVYVNFDGTSQFENTKRHT